MKNVVKTILMLSFCLNLFVQSDRNQKINNSYSGIDPGVVHFIEK